MHNTTSRRRGLIILAAAVILLTATVGSVFAYLKWFAGEADNTLSIEEPLDPSVSETFNDKVKSDVAVNVGDPGYAVYVRAAIVITWKNEGSVLADKPVEGTDYSIDLNTADWFYHEGYYYHKAFVTEGNTEVLINKLEQLVSNRSDGYSLSVDILTQTIQALGTTDAGETPAVTDAWGIGVDADKNLTPAP